MSQTQNTQVSPAEEVEQLGGIRITQEGNAPDVRNVVNDTNRAYQFDDADVILISAKDNLRFRCHSFMLMAGSRFFKDMMFGNADWCEHNPTIITLTDEEYETGAAVRFFLHCLYGQWDVLFEQGKHVYLWVSGSRLLDKYQCDAVTRTLISVCQHPLTQGSLSPLTAFVFGAHTSNIELCSLAIENARCRNSHMEAQPRLNQWVKGGSVFDLRTMSRDMFLLIPPKYAHALLRATLDVTFKVPITPENKPDWKKVAADFKRLWEEQEAIDKAGFT